MLRPRLLAPACAFFGAWLTSASIVRAQTTIDNAVTPTLGFFNTSGNNLTLTGIASGTVSGVIIGTGSLTKSGTGTWILSTDNTLSADTTITDGILELTEAGGLSNSVVTIASGGTLAADGSTSSNFGFYTIGGLSGAGALSLSSSAFLNVGASTTDTTFSGNLSGSGVLIKVGAGTFTFNGTSSGPEVGVSGGTLIFAPSSSSTYSAGVFTIGGTLVLAPADPSKFIGGISVFDGSLTISLPNSTPLGAPEINASGGIVTLGETHKATALSRTILNASGATFSLPGQGTVLGGLSGSSLTLALTGSVASPTLTLGANDISSSFGGTLSVTGGSGLQIIKIGAGTWSLSSPLGLIAPRVQAGYVELFSSSGGVDVQLEGGGLRFGQAMTHTGAILLSSGSQSLINTGSHNVTTSGSITAVNPTDALTKIGAGTLTLTGDRASGGSGFFGTLGLNAGTVAISQPANLGYDSAALAARLSFGGGTLRTTASFTSEYQSAVLEAGGGTFDVLSGTTLTWNSAITGTGPLAKTGAGTLIFTANNSYSGPTTINGGTLAFAGAGSVYNAGASPGSLIVNSGGTLLFTQDNTLGGHNVASPSRVIINAGGLVTNGGTGTFNTFNHLTLNGGELRADGGYGDDFPSYQLLENVTVGGTVASRITTTGAANSGIHLGNNTPDGTTTFQVADVTADAADDLSIAALLMDGRNADSTVHVPSGLVKTGAGTLTLSAANTFSGPTTVNQGTLALGHGLALQFSTLDHVGGTLDFTTLTSATVGGLAGTSPLVLTNASAAPIALTVGANGRSTTYAGDLSGAGSLTKTGDGILSLTGTNSYSGTTTVSAGTLALGAFNALPASSALTVAAGATLDLGGFSRSLDSVAGAGSVALGSGTLTVGGNNASTTFAGAFTGPGSLVKTGGGTLTLGGANTFTGPTTVSQGTLDLTHVDALQHSTVNLGAGTSLTFGFDNTYHVGALSGSGAVHYTTYDGPPPSFYSHGHALDVGANGASTTFSGSITGDNAFSTLSKVGAGTLTFTGTNPANVWLIVTDGTLVLSPSSSAVHAANVSVYQSGTAIVAPPDPSKFAGNVSANDGGTVILSLPNATPLALSEVAINDGTVKMDTTHAATALSRSTLALFNGGTFVLPETGTVLGGLSGYGAATLELASAPWAFPFVDLTIGANDISSSFGGTLSLSGGGDIRLRKIGTGTWGLASNLSFAPIVADGYIALDAGASGTGIQFQGGGLRYTQAMNHTGGISAGSSGGTIDTGAHNVTLSSFFGGGRSDLRPITKIGSGTLTLTDTTSSGNTFFGTLAINEGTVAISNARYLGNDDPDHGALISFGGGTLRSTADLTSGHAMLLSSGGGTFEVASGTTLTLQGGLSGTSGNLAKSGLGTLRFNAANTYTGATTVSAGTLALGVVNALPASSPLTIAAGATLDLAGFSQSLNSVTGPGSIALNSGSLILGGNHASTTFAVTLNGPGSLVKTGNGTLTLPAASAFTGSTTVNQGTLNLTHVNALQHSTVNLGAGTSLAFGFDNAYNVGALSGPGAVHYTGPDSGSSSYHPRRIEVGANGGSTTFSGSITGNGTSSSLVKVGAGTFTFTGTNPAQILLGVTGGTLNFAPSSAANFNQGVIALNGGTLLVAPPDPSKVIGYISALSGGSVTLALPNSTPLGTFRVGVASGGTLTQDPTYFATALSNTTLDFNNGGTFAMPASGTVLGGLSGNGPATIAVQASPFPSFPSLTIGANNISSGFGGTLSLSGSGSHLNVIKIGTGTWSLFGARLNFAPIVREGFVQLYANTAATGIQFQGGGVKYGEAMTHTGGISAGSSGGTIDTGANNVTLSALYSGSRTDLRPITKIGSGTLTLTGQSTFFGRLAIDAGTVAISNAQNLGYNDRDNGAIISLGGGTLRSTANLTSSHTMLLTTGGGTFEVAPSTTLTLQGGLSGTSGNLSKSGTGTLTLAGTNTYTGATTVSAGRLHLTGSAASSAFTVQNGATLTGTGLLGALTLANGATLAPGNSPGTLTAGNTTWAGGARYEFEINAATGTAGTNWDLLAVSGTLAINASSANPFAIDVLSLTSGNVAGSLSGLAPGQTYTWELATAAGGITGFAADKFLLNTAQFTSANSSIGGTFALQLGDGSMNNAPGSSLDLVYIGASAIPEPSTYAALAGLATLAFAAHGRHQRRAR